MSFVQVMKNENSAPAPETCLPSFKSNTCSVRLLMGDLRFVRTDASECQMTRQQFFREWVLKAPNGPNSAQDKTKINPPLPGSLLASKPFREMEESANIQGKEAPI